MVLPLASYSTWQSGPYISPEQPSRTGPGDGPRRASPDCVIQKELAQPFFCCKAALGVGGGASPFPHPLPTKAVRRAGPRVMRVGELTLPCQLQHMEEWALHLVWIQLALMVKVWVSV